MIEVLTMKDLKTLRDDELRVSIEYDRISEEMMKRGHKDISAIFKEMADDERDHEKNLIKLIKRKEIIHRLKNSIKF